MTLAAQAPTSVAEMGKMKQRITDLERALRRRGGGPVGAIVSFNQTGPLSAGTHSDGWSHPTGATLLYCIATLDVVGASDTVVSLRRTHTEFDSFIVPAGTLGPIVAGTDQIFRAQLDIASVATPSVGSGAAGLTVQMVFGL